MVAGNFYYVIESDDDDDDDDDFSFNDALIQCACGGVGMGWGLSFASKWYINLVWYWND